MSYFVFVFIGCTCMYAGAKILSSEERNKVFNRFPIQVEDVKKYNKFCAILVIGFGVVAELTMLCAYALGGLLSIVFTLLLIVEARIVMKIYSKGEKKMLKKR
ncbi:MAG: hypothetical protein HFH95_04580 [Lachnospiraceae bacterium]|nr:hypothetical protein [uncultured Acetatifactor sp.]MCI8542576.1 hypothetical protein [Lachnospiraceae bacterium]